MADTGWKSPTALGDNNDWTDGINAYTSDDSYAYITTTSSSNRVQSYSEFGFAIPEGATILGIEVSVEHYEVGDESVGRPAFPWTCTSDSASADYKSPDWSLSETTDVLGSSTDLWGRTPIDTDFSDDNFVIRAYFRSDGVATKSCYLDHIQVKVYYTVGITWNTKTLTKWNTKTVSKWNTK